MHNRQIIIIVIASNKVELLTYMLLLYVFIESINFISVRVFVTNLMLM